MAKDPLNVIVTKIEAGLEKAVAKLDLTGPLKVQATSKKGSFGDFNSPVFALAKAAKRNPKEVAAEIAKAFPKLKYLKEVTATGGFVNFVLDRKVCSKVILSKMLSSKNFHKSSVYKGKKFIVEHTSANPNGPIHIGNFRGSIIGDTFARLLKAVGAKVETNFYVDDLGHQIPVMVIGYNLVKKYGKVPRKVKIDHFLGQIYGVTHTMYDIQKMKQRLKQDFSLDLQGSSYWLTAEELKLFAEQFPKGDKPEAFVEIDEKLQFFLNLQTDIHSRFKDLYSLIKDALEKEQLDIPSSVLDLNRRYMEQEKTAVKQVRSACQDVLRGQKEELALMNISHKNYDWEADLQWSGAVAEALEKLHSNDFLIEEEQARLFDANKAADLPGARDYLGLKPTYEVPKAIVITSGGDSLYLLRDIPYSIQKVEKYHADRVFNVIGKQQELTQKQLNLALRAIGRRDVADKLWHLNYEYMELKGALTSMSARRLQYITPLELYEQTKEAVHENFLQERDYPAEEKEQIAHIVAVGAIKYSIIAVGLMRKMIFDPQAVVSLTNNTGPFIQYSFVRSQNILAKTTFEWSKEQAEALLSLGEDEEWSLILALGQFPSIIQEAAVNIKPELVCNYLFELANLFNKFYDTHRVLTAENEELITARLALTKVTRAVLQTGLALLGITTPKRM